MKLHKALLFEIGKYWKKLVWLAVSLIWLLAASPVEAQTTRLIVRVEGGQLVLKTLCLVLGCNVQYGLGDNQGQVFLVTTSNPLLGTVLQTVSAILDVGPDVVAQAMDATSAGPTPAALYDSTPVNYYGTTVRQGYIEQTPTSIVGLQNTQSTFGVSGSGIVAVIDTGVDTTHPVLQRVLLPGYDFTRNKPGADEKADVTQSTTAVVDQSTTAVVDQSTTAVVDQYTANVLNQPQYKDFGHGTMVSGVVHLVAPTAQILPLKVFQANGSGYISDAIRAIYYAVQNNAKVINMSFSTPTPVQELKSALDYANQMGVISVAAAGNSGEQTLVYPAAYQSDVMGVASTSDIDTLSTFSNYGPQLVWLGAPGEGIVTLYPYGTYAATWGTSFSTPFVAGTVALLLNTQVAGVVRSPVCTQALAAAAVAHAKYISSAVGNGRLQLYQAVQAWRQSLGLL
jgi:hypothetical protein